MNTTSAKNSPDQLLKSHQWVAIPSQLPNIDYDNHPAYRLAFPKSTFFTKIKAHWLFWSNLIFVFVRWLVDYDNLPLLTRHKDGRSLSSFVRILVPFVAVFLKAKGRRLKERLLGGLQVQSNSSQVHKALVDNGVVTIRLDANERDFLRQISEPAFRRLKARRHMESNKNRQFEDSRLRTSRHGDSQLYSAVAEILDRHGVIDAASMYLNRNVGVKDINPQINDVTDKFWRDQFGDVAIPNSSTTYVHFDAGYGVLKLIIYLSEVKEDNGPFSYIRGTNRIKVGYWDGLVRRANDYAGLSSTARESRRLFLALPRPLRRKCAFGADVLDASETAEWILSNEHCITSERGDVVLFDPAGLHRGGLVVDGERVVLTVVLGSMV